MLEDSIRSFCVLPQCAVTKLIVEKTPSGNDTAHTSTSQQYVHDVYGFLCQAKLSRLDGSEIASGVIRRELEHLRARVGKLPYVESFVAFVSMEAARKIHYAVSGGSNFIGRNSIFQQHCKTQQHASMVTAVRPNEEWNPFCLRQGMCLLMNKLKSEVASRTTRVPRHLLTQFQCASHGMEGDVNLSNVTDSYFEDQLVSSWARHDDDATTDWFVLQARVASQVFTTFLRHPRENNKHRSCDVLSMWKPEDWEAHVTIIPRVGLATTNSDLLKGYAVPLHRSRDVCWSSGSRTRLPLTHPLSVSGILLLLELNLSSETQSERCLEFIIAEATTQSLPTCTCEGKREASASCCIVLVIQDDLDKETRSHIEGWTSKLLWKMQRGDAECCSPPPPEILILSSVGKSTMYRLAIMLRTLPAPDWSDSGVAVTHLNPTSSCVRFHLDVGEDAIENTSSRAHISSTFCVVALDLVATRRDASDDRHREEESFSGSDKTFVSVILSGPSAAVVSGMEVFFWQHLFTLRNLYMRGEGEWSTMIPGHGLWQIACSKAAEAYAVAPSVGETHAEASIRCVVGRALSEALDNYLCHVLMQSEEGATVEHAMERISTIKCRSEFPSVDVQALGDFYRYAVPMPPLLQMRDDDGGSGDSVILADLHEWIPVWQVKEMLQSVCRVMIQLGLNGSISSNTPALYTLSV